MGMADISILLTCMAVLLPRFGAKGAAVATLITALAILPLRFTLAQSVLGGVLRRSGRRRVATRSRRDCHVLALSDAWRRHGRVVGNGNSDRASRRICGRRDLRLHQRHCHVVVVRGATARRRDNYRSDCAPLPVAVNLNSRTQSFDPLDLAAGLTE